MSVAAALLSYHLMC